MTVQRISVLTEHECACPNAHPHLDEFIANDVHVHFEVMGDAQFWLMIRAEDGREWHINCGAVNERARGYCLIEEDT